MIDADNFISNMNDDINGNYNEEMFKSRLEEINNNINNLNSQIDEWIDVKKTNKVDIIIVLIFIVLSFISSSVLFIISEIGWLIVYKKCIIPHKINNLESKIEVEEKKLKKEIKQYEKFKEKKKKMLKDDKDYKKIRKNLLEKIDNLDKDELLAIRTVITEYITNRDIPNQVGNIAQFLTETQVGDVDIKDTSLYNKQVDDEARGKGKAKIYYINGQKLD